MKILCLHGGGTSSKIFEFQSSAIRRELRGDIPYVFDFLEGCVDWPPAPGIRTLVPEETEFFGYYDLDQPHTILQAVDDLAEYIKSEGPFDGVFGFSQGAGLVAMLLLRDHNEISPIFSFAVLFCAAGIFDTESLSMGKLRYLDPAINKERITIPTAHIIGAMDHYLAHSRNIYDMCLPTMRIILDHGGGHEIPLAPATTIQNIANIIRKAISKGLH